MTKTVKIPLSSETCRNIKQGIGWSLWLLVTGALIAGAIYTLLYADDIAKGISIFPAMFAGMSLFFMCWELRDRKIWIEFKCNCDDESKPRGNVYDKNGKLIKIEN